MVSSPMNSKRLHGEASDSMASLNTLVNVIKCKNHTGTYITAILSQYTESCEIQYFAIMHSTGFHENEVTINTNMVFRLIK